MSSPEKLSLPLALARIADDQDKRGLPSRSGTDLQDEVVRIRDVGVHVLEVVRCRRPDRVLDIALIWAAADDLARSPTRLQGILRADVIVDGHLVRVERWCHPCRWDEQ